MAAWQWESVMAFVKGRRWLALLAPAALFLVWFFWHSRNAVVQSRVVPPPVVPAAPGAVSRSEYYRSKVSQEQMAGAQAAARAGGSYVAGINSPADAGLGLAPTATRTPTPTPTPTPAPTTANRAAAQIVGQAAAAQRGEAEMKLLSDASRNMMREMGQLVQSWKPPKIVVAELAAPKAEGAGKTEQRGAQAAVAWCSLPVPPAGKVGYAVADIAIDSDVPSPVVVRMESGELRGMELLGSFKRVQDKGLVLTFDRLSAPDGRSCRVAAVALNLETTGAAVASSVNHHYLERYGTLLASAFLQGYGEAVLAANTTYMVSPLGGATVVSALPKSQEFLYALGQVGEELGANMQSLFNIPPTIKVDPGTALAILFLGTPEETKQAAPVTTAPAAAQGQSAAARAQGAPAGVAPAYGTANLPPNIRIYGYGGTPYSVPPGSGQPAGWPAPAQ